MATRRIVVLANSLKRSPGRCVAGKVIDAAQQIGGWLRPISELPQGELLPRHFKVEYNAKVRVLDLLDIPVTSCANDPVHPEDWRLDPNVLWRVVGKFPIARINELQESPADLWGGSSEFGDRVIHREVLAQRVTQSLYFIRPENFRIELSNNFNPAEGLPIARRKACFDYRGRFYSLNITDSVFLDKHTWRYPMPDVPPVVIIPKCGDRCLICVSLTPVFNGYHYKVVATILETP